MWAPYRFAVLFNEALSVLCAKKATCVKRCWQKRECLRKTETERYGK